MNIKIKKIIQFILWQGFEKPVTKIQKIVSIIIIFLNIFEINIKNNINFVLFFEYYAIWMLFFWRCI